MYPRPMTRPSRPPVLHAALVAFAMLGTLAVILSVLYILAMVFVFNGAG